MMKAANHNLQKYQAAQKGSHMENLNHFEIESLIGAVELPVLSENAGDRLSCLFASCNSI